MNKKNQLSNFSLAMILVVTSLGYFVDAADIVMASVVRTDAIIKLGLANTEQSIKQIGLEFEKWQSWGILAGCFIWGIFADKKGRLKILYLSILFYSIATLVNGYITPAWGNVYEWYSLCRFVSGFGLAAEFGIAITIVSESFSKEKRGYATMIVAIFGLLGCAATCIYQLYAKPAWYMLFRIGGYAGLILLLLRIGIHESPVFKHASTQKNIRKGAFTTLFTNFSRFKRLMICVLIGIPTYFVLGLPIKFAYNFGNAFNIPDVSITITSMVFYFSTIFSDVICNSLSQYFRSRKKMFYFYNTFNLIAILIFTQYPPKTAFQYQFIYAPLLGMSVGYWALIATTAAESFGTNLRATVTTSVPNLIRSSFIPIAFLFSYFETSLGTIGSATVLGVSCSVIALIATIFLKETFSKDLKFVEKN
ncbi:MAG: MFS transporter [Sediminibacterium sp.]|nr:MFS transporter [Sediminibacterium sp.]